MRITKNVHLISVQSWTYLVYSEAHSTRSRSTKALGCGQHNGSFEGRMMDNTTSHPS